MDVILKDDTGTIYHLEEQRNLKKSDMFRFAVSHFMIAGRWGNRVTDIVLASGKPYKGKREVLTESARYTPIIVDFSEKDGERRLEEISREVADETFDNWLELVFLPLYGSQDKKKGQSIAEKVIQLETKLFHERKIPAKLLAATLIMANKMIDKDRLKQIWEDIKMLDILEIAEEKGMEKGMEKGKTEATREMLLEALMTKFDILPRRVSKQIRAMDDQDTLKALFRLVFKCSDIQEFEEKLARL